jgi:two-component sensor histidine kinase
MNVLLRARANRRVNAEATAGVRTRLLTITAVAFTPIVLFAVSLAVQRATTTRDPVLSATWAFAALIPLMMGLGAVVAVWAGAEYFVIRWLVYLERITGAYARGHYGLRPSGLDQAPTEIRWLGAAVGEMAKAVQTRDQALRGALEEQTMLVREVHHRVKNNLQIVGSLLGLQAARTENPAVREALTDALVRIDALALAQRFAEDAEDGQTVELAELFCQLAIQLKARLGRGQRRIQLEFDVDACSISPESLSPLVLIATEAVLLAYHRPSGGDALIFLSLRSNGAAPHLTMRAANDAQAFTEARDEISINLMDGYARQLHGRLDRTSEPGVLTLAITPRLAA